MAIHHKSVKYWNDMASGSWANARDAVLIGFRDATSFDRAGLEDARHLILPFIKKNYRVLDVGCGIGRLLKYVAPHCAHITGLDISKSMLTKAKKRTSNLLNTEVRVMPVSLKFPVKRKSFDFAYFYHVSEHMDRENTFKILQEIRRVLKSKGRALIQFSLIDYPDNQLEFQKWARLGDEENVRSRFYTEQEANIMLRLSNLHPQYRLYIPGEFTVIATINDTRELGQMPVFPLNTTSK